MHNVDFKWIIRGIDHMGPGLIIRSFRWEIHRSAGEKVIPGILSV
jgi:hypothetical protein